MDHNSDLQKGNFGPIRNDGKCTDMEKTAHCETRRKSWNRSPGQQPIASVPWSQSSSPLNCETVNFCYWSHPACVCCHSSCDRLTDTVKAEDGWSVTSGFLSHFWITASYPQKYILNWYLCEKKILLLCQVTKFWRPYLIHSLSAVFPWKQDFTRKQALSELFQNAPNISPSPK